LLQATQQVIEELELPATLEKMGRDQEQRRQPHVFLFWVFQTLFAAGAHGKRNTFGKKEKEEKMNHKKPHVQTSWVGSGSSLDLGCKNCSRSSW
jgi:hypothetical protein